MKLIQGDQESVYALAEKITGTCQTGRFRRELLVINVERRMSECKIHKLSQYIEYAYLHSEEYQKLVSALTIHTTSWFREDPHYVSLLKHLEKFHKSKPGRAFRLWSSACSTGEELFSAALVLEKFRKENDGFEYELFGTDIDPVSVSIAGKMIYSSVAFKQIPKIYHSSIMLGSGKTNGLMTFVSEIRKRCKFAVKNLVDFRDHSRNEKWDWIFCRNVLIYFDEKTVKDIVQGFFQKLQSSGVLCLGHSEAFSIVPSGFVSLGQACYRIVSQNGLMKEAVKFTKKKVLIIDDSIVIRKLLTKLFLADSWDVTDVESAPAADLKIKDVEYQLITLDLKMAPVDGLTWLKANRKKLKNTPVVIVSDSDPKEAEGVFGALEDGAQDYILKSFLHKNAEEFISKMNSLLKDNQISKHSIKYNQIKDIKIVNQPEVILIGASTGGPEAIGNLLKGFPGTLPPVVIVQHINESFTRPFAERLSQVSGIKVSEPVDGEILQSGRMYLAFGDYHITLKRDQTNLTLHKDFSQKHLGHRPAVDPLFFSAATVQVKSISFLLTGMGKDGAAGLKAIFDQGGSTTLAQDESSCIVFGMPKQAIDLGAAHAVANLVEMRSLLEGLAIKKKTVAA